MLIDDGTPTAGMPVAVIAAAAGMPQVRQRGNIYFIRRPRGEETLTSGLEDISRFFMISRRRPDHPLKRPFEGKLQ
jgi:hypothetical protein